MILLGGGYFVGPMWNANSCPFDAVGEIIYHYSKHLTLPPNLSNLIQDRRNEIISLDEFQNDFINILKKYINEK